MSSAVKAVPEAASKASETPVAAPVLPKVKDAWSALATAVNGSRTPLELLGKAGLKGWEVRPEPVFAWVPTGTCSECGKQVGTKHAAKCFLGGVEPGEESDGLVDADDTTESVEVPGWYALVRNNPETGSIESIGAVAREFTPEPFERRAGVLAEIAKELKAKCSAAGPLWNNTGAFMSLRIPEPIKIGKVDQLELRIVCLASLTPGRQSVIKFSVVRPASNTVQPITLPESQMGAAFSVGVDSSHVKSITGWAESAPQQIAEVANKLKAKRMTLTEFEALCEKLWTPPAETANTWLKEQHERRKAMLRVIFNGDLDMFAGIGKTRWGALQAILTVAQHLPHVELRNDDDPAETARARAESTLFGPAAKLCASAFEKVAV